MAAAMAPSRNSGLQVSGDAWEKKLTWALGIFRTVPDTGAGRADGQYSVTGRITALVVQNKDEGLLVHVGFAFSFRGDKSARHRFRFGPGTGSRSIDTSSTSVDEQLKYVSV